MELSPLKTLDSSQGSTRKGMETSAYVVHRALDGADVLPRHCLRIWLELAHLLSRFPTWTIQMLRSLELRRFDSGNPYRLMEVLSVNAISLCSKDSRVGLVLLYCVRLA